MSDETEKVEDMQLLKHISAQDLKSFGLIPELIGRLPVVSFLNPLTPSMLKNILITPKNALIKQYTKLFEMENIKLIIEEETIDYIVEKAVEYKLGARGLRSICETLLTEAMFELPSKSDVKEFVLTKEYAKEQFSQSGLSKLKAA